MAQVAKTLKPGLVENGEISVLLFEPLQTKIKDYRRPKGCAFEGDL
jgi:hypothetical protein